MTPVVPPLADTPAPVSPLVIRPNQNPDYGRVSAMGAAMDSALFVDGPTAQVVRSGRIAASQGLGSYFGLPKLSPDQISEYVRDYPELAGKITEDDNAASAGFKVDTASRRRVLNDFSSDGKYQTAQMVAGFAAQVFDPINLISARVAAGPAALARVSVGELASMSAAQRSAYISTALAEMGYPEVVKRSFVQSAKEFALTEPLNAYLAHTWTKDDYTIGDFATNLMANQLIGTGMGLLHRGLATRGIGKEKALLHSVMEAEASGRSLFNFGDKVPNEIAKAPTPETYRAETYRAETSDSVLRETTPRPMEPVDPWAERHSLDRLEKQYVRDREARVTRDDGAETIKNFIERSKTVDEWMATPRARDAVSLSRAALSPEAATAQIAESARQSDFKRMARMAKDVFGVNLRVFETGDRAFGAAEGKFHVRAGDTIFVRSDTPSFRLPELVGHEISHTISARSPRAWLEIVQSVVDSKEPEVRRAMDRFYETYALETVDTGERGGQARMFDEAMSSIVGQVFQKEWFWRDVVARVATQERPGVLRQIMDVVHSMLERVRTFLDSKDPEAQFHAETAQHFRGVAASLEKASKMLREQTATVEANMAKRGIDSYADYMERVRSYVLRNITTPDGRTGASYFADLMAVAGERYEAKIAALDQHIADNFVRNGDTLGTDASETRLKIQDRANLQSVSRTVFVPEAKLHFEAARMVGPGATHAQKTRAYEIALNRWAMGVYFKGIGDMPAPAESVRKRIAAGEPLKGTAFFKRTGDAKIQFFADLTDEYVSWGEKNKGQVMEARIQNLVTDWFGDLGVGEKRLTAVGRELRALFFPEKMEEWQADLSPLTDFQESHLLRFLQSDEFADAVEGAWRVTELEGGTKVKNPEGDPDVALQLVREAWGRYVAAERANALDPKLSAELDRLPAFLNEAPVKELALDPKVREALRAGGDRMAEQFGLGETYAKAPDAVKQKMLRDALNKEQMVKFLDQVKKIYGERAARGAEASLRIDPNADTAIRRQGIGTFDRIPGESLDFGAERKHVLTEVDLDLLDLAKDASGVDDVKTALRGRLDSVVTMDGITQPVMDHMVDQKMRLIHGYAYDRWLSEQFNKAGAKENARAVLKRYSWDGAEFPEAKFKGATDGSAFGSTVDRETVRGLGNDQATIKTQDKLDAAGADDIQALQKEADARFLEQIEADQLRSDTENIGDEMSNSITRDDAERMNRRMLDDQHQTHASYSDLKAITKLATDRANRLGYADFLASEEARKQNLPAPAQTWAVEDQPLFAALKNLDKASKDVHVELGRVSSLVDSVHGLFSDDMDEFAKRQGATFRRALDEARWQSLNGNHPGLDAVFQASAKELDAVLAAQKNSTIQRHTVNRYGRLAPEKTAADLHANLIGDPQLDKDGRLVATGESLEAAKENRTAEMLGAMKELEDRMAAGKTEAWLGEYINWVNGAKTDPALHPLFETAKRTFETVLGYVNAHGGQVRFLRDRVMPQTHNTAVIKRQFEQWRADVHRLQPDWDRVAKANGFKPGSLATTAERDRFLDGFFANLEKNSIKDRDVEFDPMKDDLSKKDRHRRVLFFQRGESMLQYDKLYGSGDPQAMFWSSMQRLVERGTYMELYGPNYMEDAASAVNRAFELQGKAKASSGTAANQSGRLIGAFEKGFGLLDNPVNPDISRVGSLIQSLSNLAVSWGSVPSSFVDLANLRLATRLAGGDAKAMNFAGYIKAMVGGLPAEHARPFMEANYVAFDSLRNAAAYVGMNSQDLKGTAGAINRWTFKTNMMNRHVRTIQWAYADVMSRIWGSHSKTGGNQQFFRWLKNYDISEAEFKTIAKHADTVDGLEGVRLAPSMIADPELRRKFSSAWTDMMNVASLRPSLQNAAWASGFSRAGTWHGQALRLVGQYKGSAMAMHTKILSRFRLTADDGSLFHMGNVGMATTFAGQALFYGWMGAMFKDLMNGREPMHMMTPDQWTSENMIRLVASSGIHGPLSDVGLSYDPNSGIGLSTKALGPVPGTAANVLGGVFSDSPTGGDRAWAAASNALPLGTFPIWGVAKHYFLGAAFNEELGRYWAARTKFGEQETGQERIVESLLYEK